MKETRRSRPPQLPASEKEAHKQMMAGCWLEECKREGKKSLSDTAEDVIKTSRYLKSRREKAGNCFSKRH